MRYFSDFHNNGHVSIDGHGSEHFGIEDAKDEAITALVEIMPYALRSGDKRDLAISVRDEYGKPVLKVAVPALWTHATSGCVGGNDVRSIIRPAREICHRRSTEELVKSARSPS